MSRLFVGEGIALEMGANVRSSGTHACQAIGRPSTR